MGNQTEIICISLYNFTEADSVINRLGEKEDKNWKKTESALLWCAEEDFCSKSNKHIQYIQNHDIKKLINH